MQNTMTITVEIPGLSELVQLLRNQTQVQASPSANASPSVPVAPAQPTMPPQMPAVPGAPQAAPLPTTAPTYALEDIMRAAGSVADAGKRQEVLNLIASFGIPALHQLPQERWGDFAAGLRGLGAQL